MQEIICLLFCLIILSDCALYHTSSLSILDYLDTDSVCCFLNKRILSHYLSKQANISFIFLTTPLCWYPLLEPFPPLSLCHPLKSNLSLSVKLTWSGDLRAHPPFWVSDVEGLLLVWSFLFYCFSHHLCPHLRNTHILPLFSRVIYSLGIV